MSQCVCASVLITEPQDFDVIRLHDCVSHCRVTHIELFLLSCFIFSVFYRRVNEQQNYNYVTPKITITAINYIFWFILLVTDLFLSWSYFKYT